MYAKPVPFAICAAFAMTHGVNAKLVYTTLVIAPGTQTGWFKPGDDVGTMNPHGYRPNEFVTNAMIYEGLTTWDPKSLGVDGIRGTPDDFVVGSLAESWTTNIDAVLGNPTTKYAITFNLRQGVTFHDGNKWNAEAAALNFDHIMGKAPGDTTKSWGGFHDWYGLVGAMDDWEAIGEYKFKVNV
jgi:ABC-type transport system substrate-binding protein